MSAQEQFYRQRNDVNRSLTNVELEAREHEQGPSMLDEGPTTNELVDKARSLLGSAEQRMNEQRALLGSEQVPEGYHQLLSERQKLVAELEQQLEQAMERQQQLREKKVGSMNIPSDQLEAYMSGTASYTVQDRLDGIADQRIRAERITAAQEVNDALVMDILNTSHRGTLIGEMALNIGGYHQATVDSYFSDSSLQEQIAELFAQLKTFDARAWNEHYHDHQSPSGEAGRGIYMSVQYTAQRALDGNYARVPDNRRWRAMVAISQKLHAIDPERFPLLSDDQVWAPDNMQRQLDAQNEQVDRLQDHTEQNMWERAYYQARKKGDVEAGREAWKNLGPDKRTLVSTNSFVRSWDGPELSQTEFRAVSQFFRARHEAQATPGREEDYRVAWSALSAEQKRHVRVLLSQEEQNK